MKQTVINKTTYGGMYVDKHFLILNTGIELQVPPQEWHEYKIGEEYPKLGAKKIKKSIYGKR